MYEYYDPYDDEWDDYNDWDIYDDEEDWDGSDPYYTCGCPTPGCLALDGHFRSECFTARDAAEYSARALGKPVPWRYREPWYTLGLLWYRVRYGSEMNRVEWSHHWYCEVKPFFGRPLYWITDHLPERCPECGRWFGHDDDCNPLPF